MASNTTDTLLNRICSCVERIEKGLGDKKKGSSAKAVATGGLAASEKTVEKLGEDIQSIADGLSAFTKASAAKATNKFIEFLQKIADTSKEMDAKAMSALSTMLPDLGKNIRNLALNLVVAAIPLLVATPIVSLGLHMLTKTFLALGKLASEAGPTVAAGVKLVTDSVYKLANAMMYISGAIAILTLSIVLSSLALSSMGMGDLGMGLGAVGGAIVALGLTVAIFAIPPVRAGIEGIKDVGKGLLYIAGAVALFTVMLIVASLGLKASGMTGGDLAFGGLAVLGAIGTLALAISAFSMPNVYLGAKAMHNAGRGLLYLLGAIALLTVVFIIGNLYNKAGGEVSIGGFATGGMFIAAGLVAVGLAVAMFSIGPVAKGAKAMNNAGKGLLFLSVAVLIMTFGLALGAKLLDVSPVEIGVSLGLILGGVAAVLYVFGNTQKTILKGSLAMGAAAVGLIILGIGLGLCFNALPRGQDGGIDWEGMGALAAAIGVLAVEVGLMGAPFTLPFILAGSAAFAAVGAGLIAFGEGMRRYAEAIRDNVDISRFPQDLNTVVSAIVTTIGGPLNILRITAASGAAIMVGKALSSLGKGVAIFAILDKMRTIKGYDNNGNPIYDDETVDVATAVENVKNLLSVDENGHSILTPFINFAKELDNPKRAGKAFEAGVKIGTMLTSLGGAIGTFANLQNLFTITGYDKNGKPIYDLSKPLNIDTAIKNITDVMSIGSEHSILDPFIKFADEISNPKRAGRAFDAGVKMGQMLSSIAEGIGTFANLQNMHLIESYDENGKPVYSNKTVNIEEAVKHIGDLMDLENENSLIFALYKLDEDVAEDITEALEELADGTSYLQKIFNENIGKVESDENGKVSNAIKIIVDAFNKSREEGGLIETLRSFGSNEAEEVADALEYLADGTKLLPSTFNINIGSIDSEIVNKATESMSKVFDLLSDNFGIDGRLGLAKGVQTYVAMRMFTSSFSTFIWFPTSYSLNSYTKGMMNLMNVAPTFAMLEYHIPKLADAMQKWADVASREEDINIACQSIGTLLSTIEQHFGDAGGVSVRSTSKSRFFGLFKKTESVIVAKPDKWKNINMRMNQLTMTMGIIASLAKPMKATNDAFEKIVNNIMKIPDTTLDILRDLTKALRDFTKEDHAENLIKAVVALQAALDTPVSENSGNEQVEQAKDTVQEAGVVINKANEAEKSEQVKKDNMTELLTGLKASLDEIKGLLSKDLNVSVSNDHIKVKYTDF